MSALRGIVIASAVLSLAAYSTSGAFACPAGHGSGVVTSSTDSPHRMQRRALALRSRPSITAEIQNTRAQLAALPGADQPHARDSLDRALDEMTFLIAQWSLSADPTCPGLVRVSTHPGSFEDGVARPGTRLGFDNPDGIYWTASVDPHYRYEIRGRRNTHHPPTDENYSVWSNKLTTLDNLGVENIHSGEDGGFTITIDSAPANGRTNHLQLKEGADTIMMRATMADWSHGVAPLYTIRRVGQGKPSPASAFSPERTMIEKLRFWTRFEANLITDLISRPANTFFQPRVINDTGALVTQANSWGRVHVEEDEALLVTVTLGRYRYFVLPVTDFWTITDDYRNIQRSLNSTQAIPNADGTYTFVLSNRDPGYLNWINVEGLPDATVMMRWQRPEPNIDLREQPRISVQLTKIAALAGIVPEDFPRSTSERRRQQSAEREPGYDRLFRQ